MSVSGKVCVVTGASSGIGRRTALDLASEGAHVCVTARRAHRLEALVAELDGDGHRYVAADVSDEDDVAGLARRVEEIYGRVDVLVNNAGLSKGRDFTGVASLPDLREVMATNFFGVANCTAHLLPLLERAAPSNIVNVASIAGRVTFGKASAYIASKFALVGWSESLRYDLADRGITVSLIEPGPLPTEGFEQKALRDHPVLRRALTDEAEVSRAIRSVIASGKAQRVVPRPYYLARLPRMLVPPLYRAAARRLATPNVPKSADGKDREEG